MFCSDAIAVVENAKDNLGRVQIYADGILVRKGNGHVTRTYLDDALWPTQHEPLGFLSSIHR